MARVPRDEELDPVEAADQADDPETELDGFQDVEDGDAPDFDEDDDLDDDLEEVEADPDVEVLDEEQVDGAAVAGLLEDEAEIVAAVEDDDVGEDDDALKEGEFVCRSCFIAKRESALADPDAMLCRDCA